MEIRDTRNGEWHWVNNAVIACPHITHTEKCIYSALATFGGCKEIHPSYELIAERAATTKRVAIRSVNKLVKIGYLSVKKGGGRGNANIYDLLKVPKGCLKCTLYKGCLKEQERVTKTTIKGDQNDPPIDKELNKELDKEYSVSASPPRSEIVNELKKDFSFKKWTDWLKGSPQRHIQIIGAFAELQNSDIQTYNQGERFIKRHLKAASVLTDFNDNQIEKAWAKVEEAKYIKKPTLETILKFLI